MQKRSVCCIYLQMLDKALASRIWGSFVLSWSTWLQTADVFPPKEQIDNVHIQHSSEKLRRKLQIFYPPLFWGITSLNSAAGTATIKAELGNQVSFMRTRINHCTHKNRY